MESVAEAHAGTVTFIQRFDSALRLNVHAHTLVLDGVYVRNSGQTADGIRIEGRFKGLVAHW
jgi:hypothetical protein